MTTTFESILLQAQPQPGGGMMMPIMLVGMIVVMYFFMIRPQQKRAKEQKKFAESMNTGDKIITTSGIHGRIVRTNDDGTIVIEIDRNTSITIERSAISMEMTVAYQKRTGQASVVAGVK
jgi:preprotein translocase subunit YajC